MPNKDFKNEGYWSSVWSRHIDGYVSAPSRCGYFLDDIFSNEFKVLEIAGGSCRDSRFLASIGYDVTVSDFDESTLRIVEKKFESSGLNFSVENAFDISFSDKEFDITFSNGFWVLFDDEDIYKLIREQARVTRKYLICLVHNNENLSLKETFGNRKKYDELYDIRFFDRSELLSIVDNSSLVYKSVRFLKFGGWPDRLFSKKIFGKVGFLDSVIRKIVPFMYRIVNWKGVERIVMVVEL